MKRIRTIVMVPVYVFVFVSAIFGAVNYFTHDSLTQMQMYKWFFERFGVAYAVALLGYFWAKR